MDTCTKVFLRRKEISGERISLYLDFYPPIRNPHTNRMSRREGLGIYLYKNPKNANEREFNATMEEKAEAIRCRRFEQLLNEQFGFLDKEKLRMDFLDYFRKKCYKKYQKWTIVYEHFYDFCGGKCLLGEITEDFCKRFMNYLLEGGRRDGRKSKLAHNSIAGYWATFRTLLKEAYQEKLLRENINDHLEKIEWKETKIEFLSLDEVKKLAATPCKYEVLKRASLFSCLTGLRISDILQLRWEHIVKAEDGYVMRLRTEKTDDEATLPLTLEALEICGEREDGIVFKGLQRHMINYPLKTWIREAGINRRITFHCFRHTYATLLSSNGVPIYTISKLLTHRSVKNTQIYAEVTDPNKRSATSTISLK
ncbi:MAG: site-specific integrase [Bacteroides sp.]|nr:site-specific integrase [Bacteroides sp.]